VSPSNSEKDMEEKRSLYLAKGAKEVWICNEQGKLTYCCYRGQLEKSQLFPTMFDKLEI
jgi:Uma2 family endonuclease